MSSSEWNALGSCIATGQARSQQDVGIDADPTRYYLSR